MKPDLRRSDISRSDISRSDISVDKLPEAVSRALKKEGRRFGHQTARVTNDGFIAVEVLLLDVLGGGGEIISARLLPGAVSYPCVTPFVHAAHRAERAIGDFFGLEAQGHPLWKSLILHSDAWPGDFHPLRENKNYVTPPYEFVTVKGEGIHEIPVGPIHAGIIEPGHFRFSCLGEIVANLEIRLGYQHRGVEKALENIPWKRARYIAESASSDTAVGNALAHTAAIEQMLNFKAPARAESLRTIALEVERLANHLGDMGGLSADIGYSAGASIFARLRGAALGLGELLTGTRLQRWYVLPGGASRDLSGAELSAFMSALSKLSGQVKNNIPLVIEHPSVIERMEGTGRLSKSLALEFGIVGPAARASGIKYDARAVFSHGVYPEKAPVIALRTEGDVLARARVRADEIMTSLELIRMLAEELPQTSIYEEISACLPPDSVGIGVVEAWRGELIHWVTTDKEGNISRYSIKDPSFNNWTALAIAVRGNLVSDFPLCNKSFNLSYSGNDL